MTKEPVHKILSHDEVLQLLSEHAKNGSITAACALERALRARERLAPEGPLDDELDRLLRDE